MVIPATIVEGGPGGDRLYGGLGHTCSEGSLAVILGYLHSTLYIFPWLYLGASTHIYILRGGLGLRVYTLMVILECFLGVLQGGGLLSRGIHAH